MGALSDIWAVARREFLYIWRDSRLRSVVMVAPFVYAALFCLVYSKHTLEEVPIALLQQDASSPARTLVRMLEASPKLNIAYRVQSVEEIRDLILRGKIDAAVVIPADFTLQLKRGRNATVTAYLDAASMVAANIGAKGLNEVVQTFAAGIEIRTLMKKGDRLSDAQLKVTPVRLDMRPLFNPSYNYSNFMVPGLLMSILQQVILLGMALSWTGEKEHGTLPQLFGITRSPWRLMVGKALPYLLVNFIVAEFYLRVLFPLNDIPMEGSWTLAVPFTALFILTIVSWGMWVSGLCKTRLFATQVLMFVAMPSFVLSGFTWPLRAMPEAVQVVGHMLPMTYFVSSFRRVYLAAAPVEYVLPDIAVLVGFSVANIALAWLVIRRLVRQHPAV